MNTLVRLIYASRLAKGCGPKDIDAIIKISRVKNAKAQDASMGPRSLTLAATPESRSRNATAT